MENQAVEVIKAKTNRVVVSIQTDFHMQLVCIMGHMFYVKVYRSPQKCQIIFGELFLNSKSFYL